MKRFILCLLCSAGTVFGQVSSVQVDPTGNVIGPSIVNFATGGLMVNGVPIGGGGSGTVTSVSVTAPLAALPNPITTSGTISITPGSFEVPLTFSQSVARAVNTVTLLNDAASPGNSRYYGTDSGGTKGWFALPAGGSGTVTDFSAGNLSPLFTTTEATTTTTPALSFALDATSPATSVYGRAAGTIGTASFSTAPQFLKIGNLTTNGFVKTGSADGTLSIDTATYLTANQNISLTGDVTGGPSATSIATTIGNNKVTLAMMGTMATDSILGRKTAATGNVEVLTALPWADTGDVTRAADGTATVLAAGNAGNLNSGTLLAARMPAFTGDVTSSVGTVANTLVNIPAATTIAGAAGVQGDVIYRSATGWAKLAAGTNGNQLTTHAAGADPTWDAPGSGGGGTPGGVNTQVQFNDSSAFGGDAGLTYDKATDKLTAVGGFFSGAAGLVDVGGGPALQSSGTTTLMASGPSYEVRSDCVFLWSNTTSVPSAADTGIVRNAAGVVEINNGTPGTYRDLIVRNVTQSGTQSGGTITSTRINPRVSTSATGNTTPTPNGDTDDQYVATGMTVNMVFGAPTGTPVDGQELLIRIKDSGSARTLGWNAIYRFSTDMVAPTTTVISKTLYMGFIYNSVDAKWDNVAQQNNF